MKSILTFLFFFVVTRTFAQVGIIIGNDGMTVKSGTIFTLEDLVLTPSSDFQPATTSLYKSNIPVTINSAKSINYVFRFTQSVNFTGKAQINFVPAELNGNDKSKLQIAHANDIQGYVLSPGTIGNNLVFGSFTNSKLRAITAVESGQALPVKLINFTVGAELRNAVLKWSTAYEINADHFEIEYSTDTKSWNNIGLIAAVGEHTENNDYQYVHADVADGTNYYRLKMIDRDETFAYSTIKNVTFKLSDDISVYPNPASERILMKNIAKNNIVKVTIYDKSGISRYENTAFPKEGIGIGNLAQGIYILTVVRENGLKSSQKFMKL